MVVYADVLIILNFLVDYFLIRLTAVISHSTYKAYRILLACAFGGVSSLCIFLPSLNFVLDILLKLSLAFITTLITFGFNCIKAFLRNTAIFFAVSFAYAGAMLLLLQTLTPQNMTVNNSFVYFNISPVMLIVFSVAAYFIAAILRHFLSKNQSEADSCKISFFANKKQIDTTALIDSGNSLNDAFGMSDIIIADKKICDSLFSSLSSDEKKSRYRAIPCNTVSGTEILDGYRADKAVIFSESINTELYRPIIAVSKTPMSSEAKAIINPRSI